LSEWVEGEEEDPSYTPTDTEAGTVPKARMRKKGKEVERWEQMSKEERCVQCAGKAEPCEVNVAAVEKWNADVAAGEVFSKAPAGVGCTVCKRKKHTCYLPRTARLRELIVPETKEGRMKRKRKDADAEEEMDGEGEKDAVEEEARPVKKVRVRRAVESAGEPAWLGPLLRLGEKIGKQVQRSAVAMERIAELLEMAEYLPPADRTESEGDESDEEEVAEELEELQREGSELRRLRKGEAEGSKVAAKTAAEDEAME
jgi:hypothetical protein